MVRVRPKTHQYSFIVFCLFACWLLGLCMRTNVSTEWKKMIECLPSRRGLPGFFHKIHLIANVCDLFPQWIWNISEFEFNLNFIFDAATVANYYRRATTGTKQTKQNETHNKMNFFHEFTNSFVLDFWNLFLVLLFVVFLMVLEQFRVAVLYARVCDSLSFYFGHLGPTPEKAR